MLSRGRNRRRNRAAERFDSFIIDDDQVNWEERMLFKALESTNPITLHELYVFGRNPTEETRLMMAKFLHKELPVRFAQRVRDLWRLPFGLAEMTSIIELRACYERSFKRIESLPLPQTASDEERFLQLVMEIKKQDSHDQVPLATCLPVVPLTLRHEGLSEELVRCF